MGISYTSPLPYHGATLVVYVNTLPLPRFTRIVNVCPGSNPILGFVKHILVTVLPGMRSSSVPGSQAVESGLTPILGVVLIVVSPICIDVTESALAP